MPSMPLKTSAPRRSAQKNKNRVLDRRARLILPPELWRAIFIIATDTLPHPLSIHDVDSLPSLSWNPRLSNEEYGKLYRESMRIKVAISQVNRYWNTVSREFLYHTIIIHRPSQITKLRRVLQYELKMSAVPATCRTWWIRSLQLKCRLDKSHFQEWSDLAFIIRSCPRLVALKAQVFPFPLPLNKSRNAPKTPWDLALASRIGRSETETHCHATLAFLNWEDSANLRLGQFLSKHPSLLSSLNNLTTLVLRYFGAGTTTAPSRAIILPVVHTLKLIDCPSWQDLSQWKFPSLRRLLVRNSMAPILGRHIFLEAHGPWITHLETDATGFKSFDQYNNTFESRYPNLQSLNIPVSVLFGVPGISWKLIHTKINTLGLWELESYRRQSTVHSISDIAKNLPNLQIIQDLSQESHVLREESIPPPEDAFFAESYRGFFNLLLHHASRRKIRLLDWTGNSIPFRKGNFGISLVLKGGIYYEYRTRELWSDSDYNL
ncbi:hypothetical protein FRC02_012287 [Tulasnella sp. 418]|nr:hypothetical protein FRC02_012287 [Tulasnella sp. 418]